MPMLVAMIMRRMLFFMGVLLVRMVMLLLGFVMTVVMLLMIMLMTAVLRVLVLLVIVSLVIMLFMVVILMIMLFMLRPIMSMIGRANFVAMKVRMRVVRFRGQEFLLQRVYFVAQRGNVRLERDLLRAGKLTEDFLDIVGNGLDHGGDGSDGRWILPQKSMDRGWFFDSLRSCTRSESLVLAATQQQ